MAPSLFDAALVSGEVLTSKRKTNLGCFLAFNAISSGASEGSRQISSTTEENGLNTFLSLHKIDL